MTEQSFDAGNLAFGSFLDEHGRAHAAVRAGDLVLSLGAAADALEPAIGSLFSTGNLDALLAAGPSRWAEIQEVITTWLTDSRYRDVVASMLRPLAAVRMQLPFTVADYVDFYASEHHATNVGRIFRPGGEPLTPNWRHLPIGYHGRAGTIVVSGTDVRRPWGQACNPDGTIRFGPSQRLDIEAEVGFVVGTGSVLGAPVPIRDFAQHVFGVCLVNDWSARDIQAWEYVPLGPFLGKSFATSISAWITPLDALAAARVRPPQRDPQPLPYLDDSSEPWGIDLDIEVRLNGEVISRPPFATMYWTAPQMLAHMTVNGAKLRTGDLFASGTVSGPEQSQRGSLLELSWNGSRPLHLADGTTRSFLQDGDEVVLTASAPAASGKRIDLGEVRGRITS